MNTKKTVTVQIKLEDYMSKEFDAVKSKIKQIDTKPLQETSAYAKKINEQAKDLAFRFIGIGAAIGTVRYLGKAIKDAGLETEQFTKATGKISATIGGALVGDVQRLTDVIVENQDRIAKFAGYAVQSIRNVFDVASSGITAAVGGIIKAVTFRKSEFGNQLVKTSLEAIKKDWAQIMAGPEAVKILDPVNREKAKSKSTLQIIGGGSYGDADAQAKKYADVVASHGGYVDSWDDTEPAKKAVEREKMIRDLSVAMIQDSSDRELAIINQKYDMMRQAAEDYGLDLQIVESARELETTRIVEQEAQKRIQINQQETAAKMQTASDYLSMTEQTFNAIASANKRNANELKNIRYMSAIIDSASAGVSAARTIWSSSKSWQEGLAATVAVEALLTAQLGAQLAQISNASYATGGDFVTNGPRVILVGDNPGGREHVSVTPESSSNVNGPKGVQPVTVNLYDNSGRLSDSISAELRNGSGERLIEEILRRVA